MSPLARVLALGAVAAIVFDASGALLARQIGFDYSWLTAGSFLLYAIVGAFGFATTSRLGSSAAAGSAVAFVEATIGWWISTRLGVTKAGPGTLAPAALASTWILVAGSGALFGLIGGGVARWRRKSAPAAA